MKTVFIQMQLANIAPTKFIHLHSSQAFKIKHIKKSHRHVLKHRKRVESRMKLSRLSMRLGLRSRPGSKRPVPDNLLYVPT
jgi:hypothetical protein